MSWLARRIGFAILLVWAVASITFLAVRLLPGDPARALMPAQSLSTQYLDTFVRLASGDLGHSLRNSSLVATEIGGRLPYTLELLGFASTLFLLVGIPGGVLAAIYRGSVLDRIGTWLSALASTVPVFVVGALLALLFARESLTDGLLPAVTLALGPSAVVFGITRAAVADVMQRDFVRAARAKGLGRTRILVHHVLRNALIPVMMALRLSFGPLLSGVVLVEYLFNYPGLARLLVEAVSVGDYPVVEGTVLAILLLFIVLNCVVDLLCAMFDPRVRIA